MTVAPDDIVIFLGPTLSKEEAESILKARYLPPVKQGDLISIASQFRPKIIGIIDGLFHENLSVWHKEILYALHQGIHLFGASSMGALRAAETAHFGMIGVGEIFQMYHEGTINDDDEVALVHGPEETGFLALSLPMVNIRFTLHEMCTKQLISKEICNRIIMISKALYFPERTLSQIAHQAREDGIDESIIQSVEDFFTSSYVDQKKKDALLLLKKIKEFALTDPADSKPSFTFQTTSYIDALYHHERKVQQDEIDVSLSQLVNFISVHHTDFSNLKAEAHHRALTIRLANLLNIQAAETDIEEEKKKFFSRHQISNDQELQFWLHKNHLSENELHHLCTEEAACQLLKQSFFEAEIPWREIKAILDHLKLTGEYEKWVERSWKTAATVSAGQL